MRNQNPQIKIYNLVKIDWIRILKYSRSLYDKIGQL